MVAAVAAAVDVAADTGFVDTKTAGVKVGPRNVVAVLTTKRYTPVAGVALA